MILNCYDPLGGKKIRLTINPFRSFCIDGMVLSGCLLTFLKRIGIEESYKSDRGNG